MPSGSRMDRQTSPPGWETGLGQLVRGGWSVTSGSGPCPPDSTLKPRNPCPSRRPCPWGATPLPGLLDCSPLGELVLGEPTHLPTPGLSVPSIRRPRDLGAARCGSGTPVLAGRAKGREGKRRGSSPCLPPSTRCRARSEVFTPHQAPPHALLGIRSQGPAPVPTVLRLSPQPFLGGGEGLAPQTLEEQGSKLGDTGEAGMSPRLAQAQPAQPLGLRLSRVTSHPCAPGRPSSLSPLPPKPPPSPGGGEYCQEFPLFPSLAKTGKGFKESLKGGTWE